MSASYRGNACCLMACNSNPDYLQWIPYAVEAWSALGITPVVLLVNTRTLPRELVRQADHIVLWPEYYDNSVLAAQVIRLFYPALLTDYRAVMISDVDLVPVMNKDYFLASVDECIQRQSFIAMRYKARQYFMPFNVAPPRVWARMFRVVSAKEVHGAMQSVLCRYQSDGRRGGVCWGTDQKLLRRAIYAARITGAVQACAPFRLCAPPQRIPVTVLNPDLYALRHNHLNQLEEFGAFQCNYRKPPRILPSDEVDDRKHIFYTCENKHFLSEQTIRSVAHLP